MPGNGSVPVDTMQTGPTPWDDAQIVLNLTEQEMITRYSKPYFEWKPPKDPVSAEAVLNLMENEPENLLLLDCRSLTDYQRAHLKGSVNLLLPPILMKRAIKNGDKVDIRKMLCGTKAKDVVDKLHTKRVILFDSQCRNPEDTKSTLGYALETLHGETPCLWYIEGGIESFEHAAGLTQQYGLQVNEPFDSPDSDMGPSAYHDAMQLRFERQLSSKVPSDDETSARPASGMRTITPSHITSDHTVTEVLPFLYLCSIDAIQNRENLKRLGVTDILNVATEAEIPDDDNGTYNVRKISLLDTAEEDLTGNIREAIRFIEHTRITGGKCIVYCVAGKSRSAAIVIAYLMKYCNIPLNDAYTMLKDKRPGIAPSFNFLGQLDLLENDRNSGKPHPFEINPLRASYSEDKIQMS